jgi:hypothetical protein
MCLDILGGGGKAAGAGVAVNSVLSSCTLRVSRHFQSVSSFGVFSRHGGRCHSEDPDSDLVSMLEKDIAVFMRRDARGFR